MNSFKIVSLNRYVLILYKSDLTHQRVEHLLIITLSIQGEVLIREEKYDLLRQNISLYYIGANLKREAIYNKRMNKMIKLKI